MVITRNVRELRVHVSSAFWLQNTLESTGYSTLPSPPRLMQHCGVQSRLDRHTDRHTHTLMQTQTPRAPQYFIRSLSGEGNNVCYCYCYWLQSSSELVLAFGNHKCQDSCLSPNSRVTPVFVLTWVEWESVSKDLLFLCSVNDDQMCSRVQSAAVLTSWQPLKIHLKTRITEIMRLLNVHEVRRTATHCNITQWPDEHVNI